MLLLQFSLAGFSCQASVPMLRMDLASKQLAFELELEEVFASKVEQEQ